MSQTETLLLFVLGFCVALFVVLLFGRGIWALMGTWAGWREARLVPAAIRELQAERDGLKAEKAMMAQKLEASFTDMKMRMAEQMAEVSRNRNRMLDMTQTIKERETTIAHLQEQLIVLESQSKSLNLQIEENVKSINLAYAKVSQREEDHTKLQNVLKDLQTTMLLREEKIKNLTDEATALREIAVGSMPSTRVSVSAPLVSEPTTQIISGFDKHFANSNAGNPLVTFDSSQISSLRAKDETPGDEKLEESPVLENSVSNVLSLAERVRNLQTGMKKA
jgi:hypothetical protein